METVMQPLNHDRSLTMTKIPKELKTQLAKSAGPQEYTKHDLVLAYLNKHGEASIDDLLVYLWVISGAVTERGYLHTVVKRLRDRGRISSQSFAEGKTTKYFITDIGRAAARPYLTKKGVLDA